MGAKTMAERYHGTNPSPLILIKGGASFDSTRGRWVFPDGSFGRFEDPRGFCAGVEGNDRKEGK